MRDFGEKSVIISQIGFERKILKYVKRMESAFCKNVQMASNGYLVGAIIYYCVMSDSLINFSNYGIILCYEMARWDVGAGWIILPVRKQTN